MRYDDRIVDQVQAGNDIVDVISQYLALKRSGRNLKACCPFHQEKSPSFMVNPEKQIFHCFGCGVGGDVFAFLMRYENMNFPEALRRLAERASIRLPEPQTSEKREGPSESEQLFEICAFAADFYHAAFLDPNKGKEALEYFLKRGYSVEVAKEFKMGWASDQWHSLFDALSKKGYKPEILVKSGLIARSPKGNYYDTFRSRILFPICNLQGKCVGFGGRLIGKTEGPKYLNSPETPVFYKRKELFGLHLAKKFIDRDHPQILVVEGYFDFLRLFQKGFKTTVATLGTALTDDHVYVLKRFAEEAIVIYDGDKAGEAASLRGLEVFLEGGMNVKLVRMPAGYDPDDYLDKEGPEAFKALVDGARDFFDYKLDVLLGRHDLRDSLGLMRVTNEFLETLTKVKNPVLLDRYMRKLAGSLGVDETSLRNELLKLKKKTAEREKLPAPASVSSGANAKPEKNANIPDVQEEIILLAIAAESPGLRETLFSEMAESDFQGQDVIELYRLLLERHQTRQPITSSQILNRIKQDNLKNKLVAILSSEWTTEEKEKMFADCVRKIKRKQVDKRLEDLRRAIAKAEREGDQDRILGFVKEYQILLKQGM